jgi:hypothetical protein
MKSRKGYSNLGRLSLIVVFGAVIAVLAFAQGFPCDSDIPRCPGCTENESCEGGAGWISECEEFHGWYYHCNSTDPDCANSQGNCNIMTQTWVDGWIVTCDLGGTEELHGGCASQVGSSFPLNQKCDNSGPCTLGVPEDEIPPLIDPYPGNTGYSDWTVQPVGADWPLDSR